MMCTKSKWGVIAGLVLVLSAGSLAAQAEKSILRLRVDGPLSEAPSDAAGLAALFAGEKVQTLYEWVSTVNKAAQDPKVDAIALIIEQPEIGLAQIEEMVQALKAFRAAGKPVYCYLDYASNASFALAANADRITLAEHSDLFILGLHGEAMYFKGLLDKLGITMDGMTCGAYKSALEPFTRTEPSPEATENINWLLDGIFERWIALIAEGRHLKPEDVRKLVDEAPLSAADALKAKLIDDVSSFPAFGEMLREKFGQDAKVLKEYGKSASEEIDWENPFAMFQMFGSLMQGMAEGKEDGLALIYVDGGIMVGESEQDGLFGTTAGSTTIRAQLEKARKDEKIKAVVLRVDSPGGSALASDIIWKAATELAKAKPLIVSMGSVAGSGGYYVSLPGQTVFADPATITASIGVLGGKMVLRGLFEGKLGITTTEFQRGRNAGLFSTNRGWDENERKEMRGFLDEVYDQFKGRVKTSRGERLKGELDGMAGGRVFTGAQALERGLVDKLGGLSDALALAREKGGLEADCEVYILPKPSELAQMVAMLEKMMGGDKGEDDFEIALRRNVGGFFGGDLGLGVLGELAPTQMREVRRLLANIVLLQRERVGCFMPTVPVIR